MIAARSAANLLLYCAGLILWSSAFIALYAGLSIGCAFGWEDRSLGPLSLQRWMLLGLWLGHLGLLALATAWMRRRARRLAARDELARFLARVNLWAMVAALAITVVNFLPVAWLSACL
jgi:hypothetical protein